MDKAESAGLTATDRRPRSRARNHFAVRVYCAVGLVCPNSKVFTLDELRLTDDMTIMHIPRHRFCTQCGSRKVTIRSVWPDRKPTGPSTGLQCSASATMKFCGRMGILRSDGRPTSDTACNTDRHWQRRKFWDRRISSERQERARLLHEKQGLRNLLCRDGVHTCCRRGSDLFRKRFY